MRLAAKLTGWRIDIKSEEEKRREVEAQFEGLERGAETGGDDAAGDEETREAAGNEEQTAEAGTEPAAGAEDTAREE